MWSQLALSLQSYNLYILSLIGLGFLGSIVIFERFIMLQLVYYIDFSTFLSHLKRAVQAEDLDRAVNQCKRASHTSLPLISLKALEAAERDPSTVRGTIEEETLNFLPGLETRIGMLPALATLILLIGVLGTIEGLWQTFNSIEILDTSEKQARLAHGIAGSLNPTSIGLLICMVLLAAHQILRGIAIKLAERIHYGVAVLNNLLVPHEVATYMAAPPHPENNMALSSGGDEYTADAGPAVDHGEEEEDDDEFDDTTVEDIKDEEEII